MRSAVLSQSRASEAPDARLNAFLRAVWALLSGAALLAAASAWLAVMLLPLRVALLVDQGVGQVGLSPWGVIVVASPLLIWAFARVFARRADAPLAAVVFWLFAAAIGASANMLALIFLHDSVVSVFVLAALGFAVAGLAHHWLRAPPSWASAVLFLGAGLVGEWIINAVLVGTWPFIAVDLTALGLFALLIALRSGALARFGEAGAPASAKAGIAYAAMYLLTLADAPPRATQNPSLNPEEPRS